MITKKIFSNNGTEVTEDGKDCVAKSSFNDESKHGRYYIKFHNGTLLDVEAATYQRRRTNAKYRQVSEKAFNFYLKFISGKGKVFLREAERALNG